MNEKIKILKDGFSKKLMITEDHLYGITLNPEEQCTTASLEEQFICTYSAFVMKLKKYDNIFKYIELYPEYSTGKSFQKKDSFPRLHFHGCCYIYPFQYYTYGARLIKKFHMLEISEEPDLQYCTKNQPLVEPWCQKLGVPYKLTFEEFQDNKKNKKVNELIKLYWARGTVEGSFKYTL